VRLCGRIGNDGLVSVCGLFTHTHTQFGKVQSNRDAIMVVKMFVRRV